MCGTKVDLGKLDMPVYLLATREDHIVPWQSAYLSTRILSGEAVSCWALPAILLG
jgi:polyhydroxyalkanoate synthase